MDCVFLAVILCLVQHHVQLFFESGTTILGTLVTISIVSPWSIVTFVPILTALYFVQRFFRSTSRELKRLDAVTRSPIYAGFSETLDGMSTIRYVIHIRMQKREY